MHFYYMLFIFWCFFWLNKLIQIFRGLLFLLILNSRFGSVVAHPDLDGEVSGLSTSHTKDFKVGTYCLSLKRCSSYFIQWTSRQRWYNSKSWLSDKITGYKTYGLLYVSSLWDIIEDVCHLSIHIIYLLLKNVTLSWVWFQLQIIPKLSYGTLCLIK